jgi:ribosome biogenesis GTP-binding protein YsxC/EngB
MISTRLIRQMNNSALQMINDRITMVRIDRYHRSVTRFINKKRTSASAQKLPQSRNGYSNRINSSNSNSNRMSMMYSDVAKGARVVRASDDTERDDVIIDGGFDDVIDEEEDDEFGLTELELAKQAKAATIKQAEFISSVVRVEDCPKTKLPEVAFIGRSNVGKSSLVNMLTNRKSVAKVSKNPGKTQTINHYEITSGQGKWFLVDLPGYGFANAPEHLKKEWSKFTKEYLLKRKNLISVMLLVDSTVKPQKLDIEALEFLADNDIPCTIVFTKADKKRKAKGGKRATPLEHVEMFAEEISDMFEELPPFIFTSANNGEGKKELLNHIATIREFMKDKSGKNDDFDDDVDELVAVEVSAEDE